LNIHGDNYQVFNLSYGGDTPILRTQFIDEMIAVKPIIVIYGFSYRDLQKGGEYPFHPLPDPKYFSHLLSKVVFSSDVNPKLITLQFIQKQLGNPFVVSKGFISFPNTPFYSYPSNQPIANDSELRRDSNNVPKFNLESIDSKIQVQYLIELIHKLQTNDIKVVLFLTPLTNQYMSAIPPSQHLIFNSTIDHIKKETNVTIYDLRYKYSDMHIWMNPHHVALNETSLIYSKDVSKIIRDELDS
jgi:hypothetical protein